MDAARLTRRREQAKTRYRANPEKYRERGRAYVTANPEQRRRTQLTARCKQFGITAAEYEEMLDRQAGHCASCGDPFTKTPHIDHCHTTGRVRGLLCSPCNTGIGLFSDNPTRLRGAITYLERTLPSNP